MTDSTRREPSLRRWARRVLRVREAPATGPRPAPSPAPGPSPLPGSAILVGTVGDLPDGTALVVDAVTNGTGRDIAVFCSAGRYYALDDTCTHRYASLAEGRIADGTVACPAHGARFSLCTGEVLSPPATEPERTHRVELRGEEIWLHPGLPGECTDA